MSLTSSISVISVLGKANEGVDCDIEKLLYVVSDKNNRSCGIVISSVPERAGYYYKLVSISKEDWVSITKDCDFYMDAIEYFYENCNLGEIQPGILEKILSGDVTYGEYLNSKDLDNAINTLIMTDPEPKACFRILWCKDISSSKIVLSVRKDLLLSLHDMMKMISKEYRPITEPSNLFKLAKTLDTDSVIAFSQTDGSYETIKLDSTTYIDTEYGRYMLNVFKDKYSEALYDSADDDIEYFVNELVEKLDSVDYTIDKKQYEEDSTYRGFVNLYLSYDDRVCIYKDTDSMLKFAYLCDS